EFSDRILRLESELSYLKESFRMKFQTEEESETIVRTPNPLPPPPPITKPYSPKLSPSEPSGLHRLQTWVMDNLFVKLGVLSILLVSVWFFTLAFENYWINESVRIWFGISVGMGVSFWGIKNYSKNTYLWPSLVGLGIAISFISYFIGYLIYDFYPTDVCFVGLFLICLFTIAISHMFSDEVIFTFAILGAFLVPILMSTGQNSYPFLFSYLLVWNLFFVLVLREKFWKIATLILIFANHTLFLAWSSESLESAEPFFPVLYFVTTYLLFLYKEFHVVKISENKIHPLSFVSIGLILFFGFIEGYLVFSEFYSKFLPALLVCIVLVFYLFYNLSIQKSIQTKDKKEEYDIIGLFGLPFIIACLVFGLEGRMLNFGLISFAFVTTISAKKSDQKFLYFVNLIVWLYVLLFTIAFNAPGNHDIFLINGRMAVFTVATCYLVLSYIYTKDYSNLSKIFLYVSYPYFLLAIFTEIHLFIRHG
ncbi:MAG: DUF2339 domain-containing protein, partial [Leptospira sp.]|nr:DUF2339 domain-containing protein [Leptospira sp.]